uniref:Uncharacterized protein n=1 Tax=Lepeophtheirus salmonis TaxID=72036 RepID=A0A0K2UBG6_LEPSM
MFNEKILVRIMAGISKCGVWGKDKCSNYCLGLNNRARAN